MKLSKIYIPAVILASLAMVACSDDNDYVAAEPDSPDCMGVSFDENNATGIIFVPCEDASIEITLHRKRTETAADVPLIGTSTLPGVKFPASAHFDAGSTDATVTIDCNGLPIKQQARITLGVPDEYINHYDFTHFNYETLALVSQWESANTDGSPVKFWFTAYDYSGYNYAPNVVKALYEPVESEMEVLPGAGRFRVHNFLNSGTDITFSLQAINLPSYVGYYRITPLDFFWTIGEIMEDESISDDWYNAWYLASPDEEDYATCNLVDLDGNPSSVYSPLFWCYSVANSIEACYVNPKTSSHPINSASMWFSGTPSDDAINIPDYFYIYFNWDGDSSL